MSPLVGAHASQTNTAEHEHALAEQPQWSLRGALCARRTGVRRSFVFLLSFAVASCFCCTLHVRVLQGPTSLTDIEWEMNCNGLTLLDLPPDQADWARRCHICTGTGLTPAISALGLGSPRPHLHRDWAHPVHIRTRPQGDATQTES